MKITDAILINRWTFDNIKGYAKYRCVNLDFKLVFIIKILAAV